MPRSQIDEQIAYIESVRRRTRNAVSCIPADKLEWTYVPGRFTLGDLVRHIAATERYLFVENARQRPSRYPGHGEELASGLDAVLAYFDRLHLESIAELKQLTDEDLAKPCTTVAGAPLKTWKWLRAMTEHEIHHRGQIYTMLGMLGVHTPSLFGLTEREVFAKSATANVS
jgi:uncharacterized damage-inducible protein DinB